MPSILDLLKMKQQPQAQPGISNTAQVQALQQAKTGKAAPDGLAPVSNIGEQVAAQQAAAQQRQVGQQAGLVQIGQAQQASGQQQQFEATSADIAQKEAHRKEALDIEKATQEAHQKVFKEAMDNEQLRAKLNRQAEQEGWTNQFKFEASLQQDIFGRTRSDMFKNLGVKNAMAADNREWEEMMTQMTGGDFLEMAAQEMKAANQKAVIEGAGKAAVAGIGYAAGPSESPTAETHGDTTTGSTGDLRSSTGERY